MIVKHLKQNALYKELSEEERSYWLDRKDKKVIHNVDTIYLNIDIPKYNENPPIQKYLEELKSKVQFEAIYVEAIDMKITGVSKRFYPYCLERTDEYMIFFAKKKITDNMPPIQIQIRAQFLWLYGEYIAIQKATEHLEKILYPFRMQIRKVYDNRIDYAYHTNYIKDMRGFFEKLNAMQVSRFKRWDMQGAFLGDQELDLDYISLGRRKSDNIFFRCYNKTKEVIEQNYKQFFFQLWKEKGLISHYDQYVYEKCSMKKRYEYSYIARLEFYLEHGKHPAHLEKCKKYIEHYDKYEFDDIMAFTEMLTPGITLITNIEFQTRRKFYKTIGDSLDELPNIKEREEEHLRYIMKLLDYKVLILKVLNEDVLRLVDMKDPKARKRNKKLHPLWELVQKCKIEHECSTDQKLLRQYQNSLDFECLKNQITNKIITLGLYLDVENENNLEEDTYNYMTLLNENDIEKALKYRNKKMPEIRAKAK